jgi:hypothetical protein
MKSLLSFAILASLLASLTAAFSPSGAVTNRISKTTTKSTTAALALPVDIAHVTTMTEKMTTPMMLQQQQSALNVGVHSFVNSLPSKFDESSTLTLSLKERPPPPTKEEIAAKKRNFNLCGYYRCYFFDVVRGG